MIIHYEIVNNHDQYMMLTEKQIRIFIGDIRWDFLMSGFDDEWQMTGIILENDSILYPTLGEIDE